MTEYPIDPIYSQDLLQFAEKIVTSQERSKLAAQSAYREAEYLVRWGNALYQFEMKSPGTKPAEYCREERLRIIRLLRDNQWYKKYL